MASGSSTAADILLSAKTEFSAYSHASKHDCWSVLSVTTPASKPESRVPIDIVAVIDVSGSMEGEKLDLVKSTLQFVVSQLTQRDRFSLVTYDSDVNVNLGLVNMIEENKIRAKRFVEAMEAGTATNLCGGLLKGMQQIARNSTPKRAQVQSVLLLTDGLANKGITLKDRIIAKMIEIQGPDCENEYFDGTVYTFGFGSDHDAGLLEAISTQGGGMYYYIDANDKVSQSFADCIGGLLSTVGQKLSLKMEINGDNLLNEAHANHAVNWIIPKKSCEVFLGDIQSDERKDILLHLVLSASPTAGKSNVIVATLSYFNVKQCTMESITCELVVNRTDINPDMPDTDVDQHKNRMLAVNAMKDAQILADQGNFEAAGMLLDEAVAQLEHSISSSSDFIKSLVGDLKLSTDSLKSHDKYFSHGRQYILSKVQSHVFQRSNFVEEQGCYTNTSKAVCREASKAFSCVL